MERRERGGRTSAETSPEDGLHGCFGPGVLSAGLLPPPRKGPKLQVQRLLERISSGPGAWGSREGGWSPRKLSSVPPVGTCLPAQASRPLPKPLS